MPISNCSKSSNKVCPKIVRGLRIFVHSRKRWKVHNFYTFMLITFCKELFFTIFSADWRSASIFFATHIKIMWKQIFRGHISTYSISREGNLQIGIKICFLACGFVYIKYGSDNLIWIRILRLKMPHFTKTMIFVSFHFFLKGTGSRERIKYFDWN